MIGIIDVGGGMRGVFTAGIYDYLIDKEITFDYYIGVSAGAGNIVSYIAKQRERNYRYYAEYSFRKEYMSMGNFIKKGSYIDLDYIYTDMCIKGGEDAIDYDTFVKNTSPFVIVSTEAKTGLPHYFTKSDMSQDHYDILKASCCIPGVCKPIKINNEYYFDGGVADPIPYKKAFEDGCDKIIVFLTRPIDTPHPPSKHRILMKFLLRKFPKVFETLENKEAKYNQQIKEIIELEKQGKILIIAPKETFGVDTLANDKAAMKKFYEHGYKEAEKILDYFKK